MRRRGDRRERQRDEDREQSEPYGARHGQPARMLGVERGAQQGRVRSPPLRRRPAPRPAPVLGVVRKRHPSRPSGSFPQGAGMCREGVLQSGPSPVAGSGRPQRARILRARPPSHWGQCGRREPQRPRIQALPYLSPGSVAGLAKAEIAPDSCFFFQILDAKVSPCARGVTWLRRFPRGTIWTQSLLTGFPSAV